MHIYRELLSKGDPDGGDEVERDKVAILIINWNGKEDTLECIRSLQEQDYPACEIIVIDNGSIDGSADAFRAIEPPINLIESEKNLGFAGGINLGVTYAMEHGMPYTLIYNNDTIADPRMVRSLVEILESDPTVGIVTGKVYDYYIPDRLLVVGKKINFSTGRMFNEGYSETDRGQHDEIREYSYIDGVFWLSRTEVFQTVGFFDTSYFYQFEEVDFCARANKHYRILYTPHAKIWHKGGKSVGGRKSPTEVYYFARNKFIFMRRYATQRQFLTFLLHQVLVDNPRELGGALIKGRFNTLLPQIRGVADGVRKAKMESPSIPGKYGG
ncbi:glycosyltransferase family 2 protein [Methanofollis aquaemaris]|uniref:Glycosyltransferase family 2 protein n=1 Tax=Methanofollis aquaemaris TaxID=126734 RepID=A0A8A3S6Q3_9EURY|nr:glycosyltransferase family 2 protein [Methanofollis aquaemaris]